MSTYCKDRYPKHTGSGYKIRYFPGADDDCSYFAPWTQDWKSPNQALSGTRERIWYDVGEPINWIQHWKYSISPSDGEPACWDIAPCIWGDITTRGDSGIFGPSYLSPGYEDPNIMALVPDTDTRNFHAREFYRMIRNAGVDKEMDGGVTLTESPGWLDFKDEILSKKNSLLSKLASGRLFYAFGLAPMASDLLGIYKAFDKVPKILEWLKATNGQPQKIKTSTKLPTPSGLQDSWKNTRYGYKFSGVECRLRHGATVTYNIDDTNISDASYQWEIWKHALGLKNPLTFIWEKIPFSFLIDWLIGIGDVLETLGTYEIFKDVKIEDPYYSIKLEGTLTYGVCWFTRKDNGDFKPSSGIRFEYYERDGLSEPPGDWYPNFNSPGLTQLINAVALQVSCRSGKK